MTLILGDTEQLEFHTDMSEIMVPIKEEIKSLNWILTDQEFTLLDYNDKGIVEKLDYETDIIRFDGRELVEILENRKIQFTWGVFCGTKRRIEKLEQIPYAEMNSGIWTNPNKFLLPDSEIEIICFDSSCTIIKFKDTELEARWRTKFTDARKLNRKGD